MRTKHKMIKFGNTNYEILHLSFKKQYSFGEGEAKLNTG